VFGSFEEAVGVEGEGALKEVVVGVAVEEGGDAGLVLLIVQGVADDDQAFLGVGEVEERVEQVDGLFLVFGEVLARGIDGERAGGADAGGVFALDVELLA